MPTKEDLIKFIQAVADATEDNQSRIGFGTPGEYLENIIGERKPTGQVWDETERVGTWPMILDGLANAFGLRVAVTGNHTHKIHEATIGVTSVPPGGLTITLMDAAEFGEGRRVSIKDENGLSGGADTIAIVVDGGGTIDGQSSKVLNLAYDGVTIYSNGTQWSIPY
jgi:hypothetical protein